MNKDYINLIKKPHEVTKTKFHNQYNEPLGRREDKNDSTDLLQLADAL
jgi:hypothetical protein